MLPSRTLSSKTNLESEVEHALLIFSKTKPFFKYLAMHFMVYLKPTDNVNGPKNTKSAFCYERHTLGEETFLVFTLAFFVIRLQYRASFLNIRVENLLYDVVEN